MKYPTQEEVLSADQETLGRWWRFLPSPNTEYEVHIMLLIHKNFKGFTPELSKKIGW